MGDWIDHFWRLKLSIFSSGPNQVSSCKTFNNEWTTDICSAGHIESQWWWCWGTSSVLMADLESYFSKAAVSGNLNITLCRNWLASWHNSFAIIFPYIKWLPPTQKNMTRFSKGQYFPIAFQRVPSNNPNPQVKMKKCAVVTWPLLYRRRRASQEVT